MRRRAVIVSLPSMRAWQITRYGAPEDAFRLSEAPAPVAGPADLVVRVRAAGINPIDLKLAAGSLRAIQRLAFPAPAGFDLAGTVVQVGADAQGFAIGDEVYARTNRLRRGAFAERVAIEAEAVARKPASLSFVEAASLPLVGLTTVQALVGRARVEPGQRVLVHAGSGGVGTFAIQYAKALGLHVTTTTSSRNAAWVRELGADEVVQYDRESILERPERYHVVYDTLGGATTLESFRLVEPGGTVVSIAGPPDAEMPRAVGAGPLVRAVMWMLRRRVEAAARKAGARYFRFLTESRGEELEQIAALVDAGKIRPMIDSTVAFEDAQVGFARVASGRAKGKVVIDVG
jgi:NADPH:quinone reductase-like Zn-dependent oxidoreductase